MKNIKVLLTVMALMWPIALVHSANAQTGSMGGGHVGGGGANGFGGGVGANEISPVPPASAGGSGGKKAESYKFKGGGSGVDSSSRGLATSDSTKKSSPGKGVRPACEEICKGNPRDPDCDCSKY